MEAVVGGLALAAVVYGLLKHLALYTSVLAYIWYMEDKKYTQPTAEELAAYKEKVILQLLHIK